MCSHSLLHSFFSIALFLTHRLSLHSSTSGLSRLRLHCQVGPSPPPSLYFWLHHPRKGGRQNRGVLSKALRQAYIQITHSLIHKGLSLSGTVDVHFLPQQNGIRKRKNTVELNGQDVKWKWEIGMMVCKQDGVNEPCTNRGTADILTL